MLAPKLAPGTSGDFTISIDATGTQVGIKYMINSIEETNKPRNLKFFFEDKKFDSLKQMEKYLTGTINANDNNKIRTFKINWEWKFETGDTEDEIIKNNAIDTEDMQKIRNYHFKICVSGEQVKL